jgi:hypothetical protein
MRHTVADVFKPVMIRALAAALLSRISVLKVAREPSGAIRYLVFMRV